MAVHRLLLRGMLVGIIAGLLASGFAKVFGEPSIDRAIAFESSQSSHRGAHDQATGHQDSDHGGSDEPQLVSRFVQSTIGLASGAVIYGGALGGLFALIFALAYGRLGRMPPRACSAILALLCFTAAFAVPYIKYPANPPAVGQPDTIGLRTALYFAMIAVSAAAMMAAFSLKRWIEPRMGTWNAVTASALAFIVLVGLAGVALPVIDEVPAQFPPGALWQFRLAAFGTQLVLWGTIGLLFGALTERSLRT